MGIKYFLTILLCELFVIPAGILCLAPMKNRLRYSIRFILLRMAVVMLALLLAVAYLNYSFDIRPNAFLIPMAILCFVAYCTCLTATLAQATAVFLFVCVIMSVVANVAHAIDALFNPTSGAGTFSMAFGLSSLALGIVVGILMFHVLSKYASFLIDHMEESKIWWMASVVSGCFLALDAFIVPQKYETLFVNRIFLTFWLVNIMVTILELLLGLVFYHIVKTMLHSSELQLKNNLLEMQESAYLKQQRYIEENARIRHDFKHTIRTLRVLAENGDPEAIRQFIDEYAGEIPEKEIVSYCDDNALNALLNYYVSSAESAGIEVDFRLEMPSREALGLSDTELCSVIGNLLENAIHAASDQEEGNRYLRLTTRIMNGKEFFITVVNSFSGKVKRHGTHYLTTKKTGSGIGLRSVSSIAQFHGGSANFHHEENEFISDVYLPLVGEQTSS